MGVSDIDSLHDLSDGSEQELTERRRLPAQARHVVAVWRSGSRVLDVGNRTEITIGRGHDCDLRIDDSSVSRRHAVLRLTPTSIEDCGSTNGTSFGGTRVPKGQRVPIPYDAPIAIGNATVVLQLVNLGRDWKSASNIEAAPVSVSAPAGTKMHELANQIALVAKSPLSVLIVGETGVGKEVATDRLHVQSGRSGALVKINCAALPEHLLEAELFGYERGAFTGAVTSKQGLVEAAEGGTLFLDEVGELPLATQAKLLRVLEAREVQRIGALRARIVDVRFVAATNRNIEGLVRAGRFRSDLYFRLNGMTLEIPALRERLEELPEYVGKFIDDMCLKLGRRSTPISEEALERLRRHPWPGNLRELRNVVDRAVLLAGHGRIEMVHVLLGPAKIFEAESPSEPGTGVTQTLTDGFPPFDVSSRSWTATRPPETAADAAERRRIVDALAKAGGNQTTAAKILGMSRRTLVYKLGQFAIPRPRKRGGEP